jgi:hypothetical protein
MRTLLVTFLEQVKIIEIDAQSGFGIMVLWTFGLLILTQKGT